MAEYKAVLVPGEYYHIFNRAVGSEKIFLKQDNYDFFLKQFKLYISPVADVFCYCLLPNHFHFFIRTKEAEDIQDAMARLKYRHKDEKDVMPTFLLQTFSNFFNSYTKALNKQQERKGKLFMEPFNRRLITTTAYYTTLIHYIHTNPIHHGFCNNVQEWANSAYRQISQLENGWLKSEEIINWFGTVNAFKQFHQQPVERKF